MRMYYQLDVRSSQYSKKMCMEPKKDNPTWGVSRNRSSPNQWACYSELKGRNQPTHWTCFWNWVPGTNHPNDHVPEQDARGQPTHWLCFQSWCAMGQISPDLVSRAVCQRPTILLSMFLDLYARGQTTHWACFQNLVQGSSQLPWACLSGDINVSM